MIIMWSKTEQISTQYPFQKLGTSPICPYQALQRLLQEIPGDSNQCFFTISRRHGALPLIDSVGRCHLYSGSQILQLSPTLKFHDFKQSEATFTMPFTMAFLYTILCTMAPGNLTQYGNVFNLLPSFPHQFLLLSTAPTCLILAVWVSLCILITSFISFYWYLLCH